MIASLRGTIIETSPKYAVLDVNGVGYKIFLTADSLHGLKTGSTATVLTHLAVREDSMDLYGFMNAKDKGLFELLITVSGIGPKGALNVLSAVASDALVNAIRSGSTAHLVKVSGIGRKTAEKIVLELSDKLGGLLVDDGSAIGMSSDMDAIAALQALGYDADESREALKKIPKDISDIGAKVKAALKMLN